MEGFENVATALVCTAMLAPLLPTKDEFRKPMNVMELAAITPRFLSFSLTVLFWQWHLSISVMVSKRSPVAVPAKTAAASSIATKS